MASLFTSNDATCGERAYVNESNLNPLSLSLFRIVCVKFQSLSRPIYTRKTLVVVSFYDANTCYSKAIAVDSKGMKIFSWVTNYCRWQRNIVHKITSNNDLPSSRIWWLFGYYQIIVRYLQTKLYLWWWIGVSLMQWNTNWKKILQVYTTVGNLIHTDTPDHSDSMTQLVRLSNVHNLFFWCCCRYRRKHGYVLRGGVLSCGILRH